MSGSSLNGIRTVAATDIYTPRERNSGLAYYVPMCPGLRLRFGANVHMDKAGRKVGWEPMRASRAELVEV